MIKKVSTILLVLVAIAGVTAAIYRQSADSNAVPATEPVVAQSAEPVVTVTYFTTQVRCASCMRIEEWTRQAVDARFSDEVDSGRVAFRMVYIDNPANEHFVEDYQLVSKSVVVSESLDGRERDWVNLQDVWLLLRDQQAFTEHVAEAVNAYL